MARVPLRPPPFVSDGAWAGVRLERVSALVEPNTRDRAPCRDEGLRREELELLVPTPA